MQNLQNTFPELETPRLLLRQIATSDAPEVFFLRSDPGVMKYIDRKRATYLQDAINFIELIQESRNKNEGILWAIVPKGSRQLAGTIGFWRMDKDNHRAEIGYVLHPSFYGKVIMSEALRCVARYGFEQMKLHSIIADINPANDASRQLLLKTGFQKEAYSRESYYFNGKFLDSEIYALLSSDIIT
jgi:[ribosomal protein S5]-alanine N-acetyltransferase